MTGTLHDARPRVKRTESFTELFNKLQKKLVNTTPHKAWFFVMNRLYALSLSTDRSYNDSGLLAH